MKIDSHQHFWHYHPEKDGWITDDMQILQRNFLPEDLLPVLLDNDIDGCIAVQAGQSEEETNFLLSLAEENDFVKGVVGWVDLQATNLKERLEYFSRFKKLKGFRHIVQGEPTGFLLRQQFLEGVKKLKSFNFTYDILIFHHQLNDVVKFVEEISDQRLIIDHCAKPDIKNNDINEWARQLKKIATNPNVYCKLSGLMTEANWTDWKEEDFNSYLETVFEAFGVKRLLFGSDWPVMLLAANYKQWKTIIEKYVEKHFPTSKEDIFGANAIGFYKC